MRERIKELSCLYEVAATFVEHRNAPRLCFQRIAAILPGACRFAGRAEACVTLDDIEETTPRWAEVRHRLTSDLVVAGQRRGSVSVGYRGARAPAASEGPFLAEERSLLDTVARQVGVFVESIEAERIRVKIEAQLRHADRLASIGQLAAGVAHELNEPLGNILGFAQLCLKADPNPPSVQADLQKIVEASLHGRDIVRKLLVFSRQAPAAPRPVNMNALIDEAMFLLEAGCENPRIRFVRRLAPGLPEIQADPVQIRQVVTNLVINAIQATPGEGVVTVSTQHAPGEVTLTIRDTGTGMTPEVAQHAFDPFFTTKEVGAGTGLGLSVVQGIVAGHAGTVDISTRPGVGSEFRVRLPIDPVAVKRGNEAL